MARTLKSDRLLFWMTLVLVAVGVVMVYSATSVTFADLYLKKQLLAACLGFALMFIVMRVDYHHYRHANGFWGLLAIVVVLLLSVFLFHKVNGTHRWIGLSGVNFQPAELAKYVAVLFTAAVLDRRMHRMDELTHTLLPIGCVTLGMTTLIVLEPDYGTSAVLLMVITAMVFAAGIRYRYLFGTAAVMIPLAWVVLHFKDYRTDRLSAWPDPWIHAQTTGWQTVQSLIAIGTGGLFGKGLMHGVQKISYLVFSHTDFIYSVVGEEFGLMGTTLMLACFVVLSWRGLRVALLAPDRFGAFLAFGITVMLAVQAMVNISVVTALLPNKGLTLPFVSYGGSSLLVNLVAMGILLNISQHAISPSVAERHTDWTLERVEA